MFSISFLNTGLIEGNLTADPELRETPNGFTLCYFSVAVNRFHKKDDGFENEVSFFDVETLNKTAENVRDICKKGHGVRVAGRLKQPRWQDADGKQKSKVYIAAEHVEFKPDKKLGDTPDEPQNGIVSQPVDNESAV